MEEAKKSQAFQRPVPQRSMTRAPERLGNDAARTKEAPIATGALEKAEPEMLKRENKDKLAMGGVEPPGHVFMVREYSWKADRQPANLGTPAWGQTVYWHALRVAPEGELNLPVTLPPGEGTYRFEVFGHDGQGRLGAATLDIKTPVVKPKPVSLKTRLSAQDAKRGDVVRLEVEVKNQTASAKSAVQAVIPLPAGMTLPPTVKQLRSSVTGPGYDTPFETTRWKVQEGELFLAWSELAGEQGVRVVVDLVCEKAGEWTASKAGRAYLLNQEEAAAEAAALVIRVVP
jgi:hypothetical protein